MRVNCTECKAEMIDGSLIHNSKCSVWVTRGETRTDFIRPPSTTISFDTPEEQAEWMRKLTGGSTNIKPNES